jgi:hypothetical protein
MTEERRVSNAMKRSGSIVAGGALALLLTLGTGALAQGTGDGTGDGSGDGSGDTTTTTAAVAGTGGTTSAGELSRTLATTGQDDALILVGGGAALGLAVGARRFLRSRSQS